MNKENKHIVLLVGSYYPYYSAVGKCMGNIADELVTRGYRVTVISLRSNQELSEMEVVNNQKIIRIDAGSIQQGKRLAQKITRVKNVCKSLASKTGAKQQLVDAYLSALINLTEKPDMLIPTCLPFETVIASVRYVSASNCALIPCLYDYFAENDRLHYFHINMVMKRKANRKLEEEMLDKSSRLLVLSTWEKYIEEVFPQYYGKTCLIEHPLVIPTNNWGEIDYGNTNQVNIVYTGIVDRKIRNPRRVIDFFLRCEIKDYNLHFYSYGNAQTIIEEAARNNSFIINHGFVPTEEAHAAIKSGDMLLSIGNSKTKQYPSKIFEYISVGKPIIHFAFSNDDIAIDVLRKYPQSCCVMLSSNDIDSERDKLRDFILNKDSHTYNYSEVSQIYPEACPQIIVDKLNI